MKTALFIDRDGTINYDCPYCHDPSKIKLYPDAPKIIRKYKKMGYLVIVVTNQSGIGRGYYTIKDMKRFNHALNQKLKKLGAGVDAFYWCPHVPEDHCSCRKPKTTLIKRAQKKFNIDLKQSLVIGDTDETDGQMARNLKMRYKIINRKERPKKQMPDITIILAGGLGTRLRPLTYRIPKPMVRVNNKPVISYIIDNLQRFGATNIILSIGYRASILKKYIDAKYGKKTRVVYSIEKELLGTGGAIKKALSSIKVPYRDVLILNGDDISDIDLNKMYEFHKEKHATITIATLRVKNVEGSGVVYIKNHKILGFIEKPDPKTVKSKMINQGIYIFTKDALQLIPKEKKFSITKDFFEKVAKKGTLYAYIAKDNWYPIDTMERYNRARRIIEK